MSEAPQSGQREETCRICLESSPIANSNPDSVSRFTDVEDEDRLISPCACSGTQAYVHYKCLQRWQQSVMASRRTGPGLISPALICSVCTHKFSVAPRRPTVGFRMRKMFTSYACEVTGIIIILLACYVALAGHNLQTLIDDFENGLSLAIEVLPCSLQMKVLEDGCNSRTCKRGGESSAVMGWVRLWSSFKLGSTWWDSSSSLHPGTLLVATPTMLSPYYFGTVVLLYEHERCRGTRGIILNKQSKEGDVLNWETQLFLGVQNSAALRHIPHATGGSHKPEDWFILQRCSPSLSSVIIVQRRQCDRKRAAKTGEEKSFLAYFWARMWGQYYVILTDVRDQVRLASRVLTSWKVPWKKKQGKVKSATMLTTRSYMVMLSGMLDNWQVL